MDEHTPEGRRLCVGLLLHPEKPEAIDVARDLLALLDERGLEAMVASAPDEALPGARHVADERLAETSILVALGGDGTLLHGADIVADHSIPVLGVNLGTLGFLTPFSAEHAREALAGALDGALECERRMRLRVAVVREHGAHEVHYASNDAVISQGGVARLLEFDAVLDGNAISTYLADGLIISTPTGSTAYNLAAGGPLLAPELRGVVLSPICPHMLTNRPLVVPASSRLSVRLGGDARGVMLTVDGQRAIDIGPRDRVEIHEAHRPLLLYRRPDLTYFDILRTKLHWGERAGRRRAEAGPRGTTSDKPDR